jgi:hypothetical protein
MATVVRVAGKQWQWGRQKEQGRRQQWRQQQGWQATKRAIAMAARAMATVTRGEANKGNKGIGNGDNVGIGNSNKGGGQWRGQEQGRQGVMAMAKRVVGDKESNGGKEMVTATRVASKQRQQQWWQQQQRGQWYRQQGWQVKGDGKGGKSKRDGNKDGNGIKKGNDKGSNSNGYGNKEGNCMKEGEDEGGKSNGNGNKGNGGKWQWCFIYGSLLPLNNSVKCMWLSW